MTKKHYKRFEQSELILRDELAIDRTLLANERTLLAYLRAAAAMMIAGLTIIHFASKGWFFAMGLACIPGSLLITLIGLFRFIKMNRAISVVRKQSEKMR
jgi:putative membrane protein